MFKVKVNLANVFLGSYKGMQFSLFAWYMLLFCSNMKLGNNNRNYLAGIYLHKVTIGNTIALWDIFSRLTIKTSLTSFYCLPCEL